jgi:hypothetical protein
MSAKEILKTYKSSFFLIELLQTELIKPMFKDEQVKEIILKDFPEVALVTDVTFQTRTRPKMLFREAQYYFSGKHKCYGLKTEISHLPNGLAAFVSNTYAGSDMILQYLKTMSIFMKNS